MSERLKGSILVILSGILWGTTGTSQGLAPKDASSASIGAMRLLIAGIYFLTVALIRGSLKGYNILFRDNVILLLGVISVVLYQLTFFYGVRLSGVAIGTVVGIGSSPIWSGVLGFIFLKEKPSKIWYTATFLGILGLNLTSLGGKSKGGFDILGIFLMLMAGLTYAVYSICAKYLMRKFSADFVMAVYFMGGAIMLSPVFFFNNIGWVLELKGLLLMLHLGFIATALAYSLFSRGLRLIPVAQATTLSLTEPLTASILGITVLGESVSPINGIGMSLIFLSLIILSKK
ncbi:MAG: DMT family transporter [Calditerrivibrio sp.]|nr:DMT family transporter [Calditerrivibrio sp.]